jgi:ABC-type antimicrobial peptide transport system permease subunit
MTLGRNDEGVDLHDVNSLSGDEQTLAGISRHGRTRTAKAKELLVELWHDRAGFIGVCFLSMLVITAVFAPLVAPHNPRQQDLVNRLQPPVWSDGG